MSDRLLGEPAALAQLTKSRERVADRAMTGAPLPSKVLAPMRARKSAVPSGCRVAPLESSWRRENRLVAGGSRMAGPGLEPGTPRFSVVDWDLSNSRGIPAIHGVPDSSPRILDVRKLRSYVANFGH